MSIIPERYVSKANKVFNVLGASSDIPINDLDAYTTYPTYNWIYNRLLLAQYQSVKCNPMPILPEDRDYPVVIKPVINLYGMGLHCYRMDNKDELLNQWYHTGFWSTFNRGKHVSYDCVVKDGYVLWHCSFIGHNSDKFFGEFDYWELSESELPKCINMLVDKLTGYTGMLNCECIDEVLIEAHLRMGDIDQLTEREVLNEVVNLYDNNSFNAENIPKKLTTIYLVPVFKDDNGDTQDLNHLETKIRNCCISQSIICYQIDDLTCAHPPGRKRYVNVTSTDLSSALIARDRILKVLNTVA